MPLSPSLAKWLVGQGHEAVHAKDIGFERASDRTIIGYAKTNGFVIVTADLDYPRLLALTHEERAGLILFRGGQYSDSEAILLLQHALKRIPAEELMGEILVIERTRLRRTRLPLEPPSAD